MNRRNQILAGIVVLQLILVAVVFWPRRAVSGKEGQSLFPGVAADQVVKLSITAGDGKTILLSKKDGNWVLPDAGDYPAQADKVPALLTKLLGLKAGGAVATTTASQARLKVAKDDFERLVEFDLADGTGHQLYIGSGPSYGASYVRADDENDVYLAANLAVQDAGTEASAWVDTAYLTIPTDQIVGLTVENAQGKFEFEKSGGAWTMAGLAAGETLNESSVQGLVNRLNPLSLVRPLGKEDKPEYGLQQPAAILTVETTSTEGGNKTYTLKVGAQDATDKSYVVISSESAYYVRVSQYSVQDLVQKGRDGFLQVPTPTPEASPTP